MLLDVASGGELHVALAAGVPADACTLHGNNKSVDELRAAIEAGVRHIVVDSFDELDRLDALHGAGAGPAPDVLLRITPGVHAHTHEYIATGQDDSKFGFNLANGDAARGRRPRPAVAVGRPRRSALPHRLQRLRRRELRAGRRGDGGLRRAARPARARPRRRARRRLRGGRGGADDHRVGEGRPRRLPRARRALGGERRTGPGDRRRGGGHAVHGRHGQAHPWRAHLRRRRRGDERQPAPGAVRQRLRSVPAPRRRRRPAAPGTRRRQALRVRRRAAVRRPRPARPGRRRPAGRPGHRRLRTLDGLELQQGAPPAGRVRRRRQRPRSSCAARRTTTSWRPTSGDAAYPCSMPRLPGRPARADPPHHGVGQERRTRHRAHDAAQGAAHSSRGSWRARRVLAGARR